MTGIDPDALREALCDALEPFADGEPFDEQECVDEVLIPALAPLLADAEQAIRRDEGRKARAAVRDYCRMSESWAGENPNPEAVGLTRAYKDITDRMDAALSESGGE